MKRGDMYAGCTVHVGGVSGELEEPSALRKHLETAFGQVVGCTVRLRRDVPGKLSWALVTFENPEIAARVLVITGPTITVACKDGGSLAALKEKNMLQARYNAERRRMMADDPHHEAVVARLGPYKLVDRLQVFGSTGSMGKMIRKHQSEVDAESQWQQNRTRPLSERYADAVLKSHKIHEWQESGVLVILKDESLEYDKSHRGWDVRIHTTQDLSTLMAKIRGNIPGMCDAEGIVRASADLQKHPHLTQMVRLARQMKHGHTYLIRSRAQKMDLTAALQLAERFKTEEGAGGSSGGDDSVRPTAASPRYAVPCMRPHDHAGACYLLLNSSAVTGYSPILGTDYTGATTKTEQTLHNDRTSTKRRGTPTCTHRSARSVCCRSNDGSNDGSNDLYARPCLPADQANTPRLRCAACVWAYHTDAGDIPREEGPQAIHPQEC